MDIEIKRWSKTASEKRAVLSRVKASTKLSDLRNCELVIESIDEEFDNKRRLIEDFYHVGKEDAVFVSNTATLSLTKLSQGIKQADRIIGMHFLNPVQKVALVEVVPRHAYLR